MNERMCILWIEEGIEYYLWLKEQVLILYKLGDMEILLEYQFLAVLRNSFLSLTFRVDAHFILVNQPLIPIVQSMSSNSIGARRHHDFS